jgi:hypothetical protein
LLGGDGELLCHQHIHRVQLHRSIDRDARDAILDAENETFVGHGVSFAYYFLTK